MAVRARGGIESLTSGRSPSMAIATFSLRRATADDAAAMWTVRCDAIRQTCRSHYPVEMLERWAATPLPETFGRRIEDEYVVVGIAGASIAGFAALKASDSLIDAVFVAPEDGRRGLGRQLLAHIEGVAIGCGLRVLRVNASLNAVPFYAAAGYESISEGIYTTSAGVQIACVRMEKPIAG
ncbi:MAG TPA: GNAT family N-acetyltransferase [Rhodanobacteraceae bacterium]